MIKLVFETGYVGLVGSGRLPHT